MFCQGRNLLNFGNLLLPLIRRHVDAAQIVRDAGDQRLRVRDIHIAQVILLNDGGVDPGVIGGAEHQIVDTDTVAEFGNATIIALALLVASPDVQDGHAILHRLPAVLQRGLLQRIAVVAALDQHCFRDHNHGWFQLLFELLDAGFELCLVDLDIIFGAVRVHRHHIAGPAAVLVEVQHAVVEQIEAAALLEQVLGLVHCERYAVSQRKRRLRGRQGNIALDFVEAEAHEIRRWSEAEILVELGHRRNAPWLVGQRVALVLGLLRVTDKRRHRSRDLDHGIRKGVFLDDVDAWCLHDSHGAFPSVARG